MGVRVAPPIRVGRPVPLLQERVTDHLAFFLHYGSRVAQPALVRAFIDLAIERLADNPRMILDPNEHAPARRRARKR